MLRARAWLVALLAAAAIAPACGGLSRFERHRDAGATSGDDDDDVTSPPDAGRPDGSGAGKGPTDAGGGARPPDAAPTDGASDAGPPDAGPPDAALPDAAPPDAALPDAGIPDWDVASVAAGGDHACVLWSDGRVSCWGRNDTGQLGDGTTINRPAATQVIELPTAVSVAAYDRFTCAVVPDGSVRCWGSTDQQRLGSVPADPDPPWVAQPVTVPNVGGAFELSGGPTAGHACALTSDWLYCWGSNDVGQLARAEPASSARAAAAIGAFRVVSAAGSYSHACMVNDFGELGCAGATPGNGQQVNTDVFNSVVAISDALAVGTGADFGCVLRTNGTVACWGTNGDGNLGNGTEEDSVEPVAVQGLEGATKLAVGAHHACALLDSSAVSCWGKNLHGQLGDGTTEQANRPVFALEHLAPEPRALENIVDIAAGNEHTCAVVGSSYVYCWGSNLYGQLGTRATDEQSPWPIKVIDTFR